MVTTRRTICAMPWQRSRGERAHEMPMKSVNKPGQTMKVSMGNDAFS
jgi:hypothetical protein